MAFNRPLRATVRENPQVPAPSIYQSHRPVSFPRWYTIGRRDGAIVGFILGFIITVATLLMMISLTTHH